MFYIVMGLGVLAMILTMWVAVKYKVNRPPLWKIIVLAMALAAIGVFSAKIMFWIENGEWGNSSYFGAVFFAPLPMVIFAQALNVQGALDLCAPAECVMLVLLKALCMKNGCCEGRVLYIYESGVAVRFPSQLAELVNALILTGVLLGAIRRGKWKGKVYALYLILYGASRFLLNLLRETDTFLLGLPAGNFWSVISVIVGLVWLLIARGKRCPESEKTT